MSIEIVRGAPRVMRVLPLIGHERRDLIHRTSPHTQIVLSKIP